MGKVIQHVDGTVEYDLPDETILKLLAARQGVQPAASPSVAPTRQPVTQTARPAPDRRAVLAAGERRPDSIASRILLVLKSDRSHVFTIAEIVERTGLPAGHVRSESARLAREERPEIRRVAAGQYQAVSEGET